MSASNPTFGLNKIALVMARLIVKGEDRGIRPFIVRICNTREPYPGIISIRQPLRSGASPLDYSMTRFQNVRLPPTALLGDTLESPTDARAAWWDTLWRIPIDSFAVSGPCVSGLKHVAYIGGKYSLHHHVTPHGEKVPIFTSRPSSGPSCTLLLRLACWRCGTAGRLHLFGPQGDSSREARPRRLGRGDHRLPIDGVCS